MKRVFAVGTAGVVAVAGLSAGTALASQTSALSNAKAAYPVTAASAGTAGSSVVLAHRQYTQRLLATAARSDRFSGSVLHPGSRTLVVQGVGTAPGQVARSIAAAPSGLAVRWESVRFSRDELLRKAEAIGKDTRVTSVLLEPDFDGLVVGLASKAPRAAVSAQRSLRTAQASLRLRGDNAIAVRFTSPMPLSPARRATDRAPFWGGSRIATSRAACTSGFPAQRRANGDDVLVFANHCSSGRPGVVWRTAQGRRPVGVSGALRSFRWDTQVLNGRRYGNAVFVGGIASNRGRRIVGPVATFSRGDRWCVSGSFSGEMCGSRITNTNLLFRTSPGGPLMGPAVVLSRPGVAVAGQGDSGSPAFTRAVGGGVRVAGILSAINTAFRERCRGIGGRVCSSRVVVIPWARFRGPLGLELK
ncbi:MAG TPA: hypothetical protein VNP20_00305 [Nocardioidaceae bacterium]|nr:hypothetical protein [Nocardioidaceae bacterium]